ncbi:hypothetical protein ACK39T_19685, partial [Aeromonas veronii]
NPMSGWITFQSAKLARVDQFSVGVDSQINKSMVQLNVMETKWLRSSESNRPVSTENLLSGDLSGDGKIKTLAQLFALEHKNIKKGK